VREAPRRSDVDASRRSSIAARPSAVRRRVRRARRGPGRGTCDVPSVDVREHADEGGAGPEVRRTNWRAGTRALAARRTAERRGECAGIAGRAARERPTRHRRRITAASE
jgi:hypothetical protein